ncbi:hypothetical protein [Nesterenkonia alkaliphila]|uniref:Uncharacterized protein n=1 Tax=Nesterenkonia alkaliphila TaxID=1463631 RepID=A0A7K1UH58_9MICC|nr:hypothetical protein [Nesterenkonia alkaliphila]MVT25726.1 hypothetical protein [Nesterenkonia alkaliphila]GFZ85386.1 hypothetical protein GCM10011359_13140 [Nesterenkonia alkaliphila]
MSTTATAGPDPLEAELHRVAASYDQLHASEASHTSTTEPEESVAGAEQLRRTWESESTLRQLEPAPEEIAEDPEPGDPSTLKLPPTETAHQEENTNGLEAYLAADVAEELAAGGPPNWLGTRWSEIDPEDQSEAWIELRRFTDWLVNEYRIPKTVIPACWYRHSQIVAELYAALNLEYKVWEEAAPSVNPMMMWLPHLQAMIGRLRTVMENMPECGKGNHSELKPMVLDYDETLWRTTVYSRREHRKLDRPARGEPNYFVRAKVTSARGAPLAYSNIGGIAPVQGPDMPTATLVGEKTPGAAETDVRLTVENIPAKSRVTWQKAPDPDGPWEEIPEEDQEAGHPPVVL